MYGLVKTLIKKEKNGEIDSQTKKKHDSKIFHIKTSRK